MHIHTPGCGRIIADWDDCSGLGAKIRRDTGGGCTVDSIVEGRESHGEEEAEDHLVMIGMLPSNLAQSFVQRLMP
jgi:hypothetical protein